MSDHHFQALEKTPANYVALSPLSFIKRAATYFADCTSIIYHDRQFTWRETYQRSCQLSDALHQSGIKKGDTVSALSPNTPALIEAHYGVAMAGAVLNTINMRLDKSVIAYILEHADCKLLLVDAGFIDLVCEVVERHNLSIKIICINDPAENIISHLGDDEYESFIAKGKPDYAWQMPEDEWQAIALNYTSGTSGKPKGVVYHHRGSYLMTMGSIVAWQMSMHPVYLYTVPLFHCNGWGYVWTVPLLGGTFVCVRNISDELIFNHIAKYKITHMGGAPIILGMLVNAKDSLKNKINDLGYTITLMTAGAPPPAAILQAVEKMNFNVMQVYGLTETYGHISYCLWRNQWDQLSSEEKAEIKSWQGMSYPMNEEIALLSEEGALISPYETGNSESEGGEIIIRGNTVMKGYYKNPEATAKAFSGGWFHSEDIAIFREQSYIQVKDRLKDIIISGGENISSVEVEGVLYQHPNINLVAVVAKQDDKWGEVPTAFIELKDPSKEPTLKEIQDFCRERMSSFKIPKALYYLELPKTATGKIQKFKLREKLKELD